MLALGLLGCADGGGDAPAEDPTPAPTEPDSTPTAGDIRDAFLQGPDRPTQVTYDLTTAAGDEALTVAWEGERLSLVRSDGQIIRTAEGAIVFCTASPEGPLCWDLEARGQAFLMNVAADLLAVHGLVPLLPDTVETIDERTIAGRDATCVRFPFTAPPRGAPAQPPRPATFCYDEKTGVGLLLDVGSGETAQKLEATSFGAPEPGIFEPPAPVQPYPEEGLTPPAPSP